MDLKLGEWENRELGLLARIIHGTSPNSRNPIHCYELCHLIEKQTVYRNPKQKRGI